MRHILPLLTLLILAQTSFGWIFRSYYTDKSTLERTQTRKSREIIRRYYPDSSIQFEGEYHRGRADGISREFYPNGSLKSEIEFRNGREDGYAHFYYESGVLQARIRYDKGKVEEIVEYSPAGIQVDSTKK